MQAYLKLSRPDRPSIGSAILGLIMPLSKYRIGISEFSPFVAVDIRHVLSTEDEIHLEAQPLFSRPS